MPEVIQLDDVKSPQHDRNMDREGCGHEGKQNCLLCGRIVDPATKWLRMTVFGEIVRPDGAACSSSSCAVRSGSRLMTTNSKVAPWPADCVAARATLLGRLGCAAPAR